MKATSYVLCGLGILCMFLGLTGLGRVFSPEANEGGLIAAGILLLTAAAFTHAHAESKPRQGDDGAAKREGTSGFTFTDNVQRHCGRCRTIMVGAPGHEKCLTCEGGGLSRHLPPSVGM